MLTRRIPVEIKTLHESPAKGITFDFTVDPTDATKYDVLLYGDGCFNGAVFYIKVSLPPEFPMKPPEVKFINANGKRFHPNFYDTGFVCMTILNTWRDPKVQGWCPIIKLETVFINMASMLHDNPLKEEPGHDTKSKESSDSINYQIASKYYSLDNTLNYLLSDQLIKPNVDLWDFLMIHFRKSKQIYLDTIEDLKTHDGKTIKYFHGIVHINTKALVEKLESVCI